MSTRPSVPVDLHMHSFYSSDGEFSPETLVERCAEQGITWMSVTDHNTVQANAAAEDAAKRHGIRYLPGIEIDCVYAGCNFHMLGYGMDYSAPDFAAIEDNIRRQCRDASLMMLEKTRGLGFDITAKELQAHTADSYWPEDWTGELFAEILLARPEYVSHPLLAPYRPGGSRSDNPYVNAYWDLYSQGKPCHAPVTCPPMEEIIACIHRNGGLAVLAHPQINLKGQPQLLDGILTLGVDGIEAFSSYHTPSQSFKLLRRAKEQALFVTCGSDFHGKTKPAISLGGHGCLLSDEALLGQLEPLIPGTVK